MNFFNDNVNYECSSFPDVKRLNEKMLDVAEKYGWLDAVKSPPVLKDFLSNFESLQVILGEIEGLFQEDENHKERLQEQAKKINSKLSRLLEEIQDLNQSQTLIQQTFASKKRY